VDNRIEYYYVDENKEPLYSKVRIEPVNGGSKRFFIERRDRSGSTVHGLGNCRRTLYNLPSVIEGISNNDPIFLVEGEKDAETLINNGYIATTAVTTTEWLDEYTDILALADIVLLYDYDKAGYKRRDMLCTKLSGNVKRLRVIDLPGLEYQEHHGKDITDWLQMGHTIQELMDISNRTPDYILEDKNEIKTITFEDFLKLDLPQREMLLSPFLPSQGLVLLYSKRGVGKTHMALGIAHAVASGGSFLKWQAPLAKRVLYIDGEMPAVSMQDRLRKMPTLDATPKPGHLQFVTPDLQFESMPNLSTPEGRDQIEKLAANFDLIILDNLSTLFRSGSENEAESWIPAQEWALSLRRKGKSVLFVHHAGKSGQQRGTSKKEDILDVVICLKRSEEHQPEHGACFDVHFEKARHFHGSDASSFSVKLCQDADGTWRWEMSQVAIDEDVIEIARLMNEGKTILEMMKLTGLTKNEVEGRRKKARVFGLVST
jgi:5S rRNA maturation endonuclease (ribonuclease M5)